jgi:predicted DNA-binding antitoxin AbrB/MazE fold protein
MTIEATYRDGVFYPTQPITLPENTRVEVAVPAGLTEPLNREEILALRPKAPKITPEEFEAIIKSNTFSAPSLPHDFSREDIYSDHD